MWTILVGAMTGLSLIVAIGAQNAFVLRQGLTGRHVGVVVAVCIAVDAVLICAGVAGIGAVTAKVPWLLDVLRWAGAAYLTWFGIRSLMSAAKPNSLRAERDRVRGRGQVLRAVLAVSLLNPHVYLDTMVMLGSLANQHGEAGRWLFALGAVTGSVLWFTCLGYGARSLSGRLSSPSTWRVLDTVIGVTMLVLAGVLVTQ
ncbi:LysE/ArgO family amino acid transporter [Dermacoccaceae bacterium W4C1]